MQTRSRHLSGNILFFTGIFLGLGLALASTWANLEGVFYFFTGATYDAFGGLHCPNLMTPSETANITATFDNPTNQDSQPYFEVEISGILPRQFDDQLTVPPHQSKSTQWTVSASDIDYGYFVFVKLNISPDAYHSERQATCGIMVLNIPALNGGQILGLILTISLLGILAGFGLWESTSDKLANDYSAKYHARQALGIIVSLALLTSLMSWWLGGIIFGALTILLLVVILRFALG